MSRPSSSSLSTAARMALGGGVPTPAARPTHAGAPRPGSSSGPSHRLPSRDGRPTSVAAATQEALAYLDMDFVSPSTVEALRGASAVPARATAAAVSDAEEEAAATYAAEDEPAAASHRAREYERLASNWSSFMSGLGAGGSVGGGSSSTAPFRPAPRVALAPAPAPAAEELDTYNVELSEEPLQAPAEPILPVVASPSKTRSSRGGVVAPSPPPRAAAPPPHSPHTPTQTVTDPASPVVAATPVAVPSLSPVKPVGALPGAASPLPETPAVAATAEDMLAAIAEMDARLEALTQKSVQLNQQRAEAQRILQARMREAALRKEQQAKHRLKQAMRGEAVVGGSGGADDEDGGGESKAQGDGSDAVSLAGSVAASSVARSVGSKQRPPVVPSGAGVGGAGRSVPSSSASVASSSRGGGARSVASSAAFPVPSARGSGAGAPLPAGGIATGRPAALQKPAPAAPAAAAAAKVQPSIDSSKPVLIKKRPPPGGALAGVAAATAAAAAAASAAALAAAVTSTSSRPGGVLPSAPFSWDAASMASEPVRRGPTFGGAALQPLPESVADDASSSALGFDLGSGGVGGAGALDFDAWDSVSMQGGGGGYDGGGGWEGGASLKARGGTGRGGGQGVKPPLGAPRAAHTGSSGSGGFGASDRDFIARNVELAGAYAPTRRLAPSEEARLASLLGGLEASAATSAAPATPEKGGTSGTAPPAVAAAGFAPSESDASRLAAVTSQLGALVRAGAASELAAPALLVEEAVLGRPFTAPLLSAGSGSLPGSPVSPAQQPRPQRPASVAGPRSPLSVSHFTAGADTVFTVAGGGKALKLLPGVFLTDVAEAAEALLAGGGGGGAGGGTIVSGGVGALSARGGVGYAPGPVAAAAIAGVSTRPAAPAGPGSPSSRAPGSSAASSSSSPPPSTVLPALQGPRVGDSVIEQQRKERLLRERAAVVDAALQALRRVPGGTAGLSASAVTAAASVIGGDEGDGGESHLLLDGGASEVGGVGGGAPGSVVGNLLTLLADPNAAVRGKGVGGGGGVAPGRGGGGGGGGSSHSLVSALSRGTTTRRLTRGDLAAEVAAAAAQLARAATSGSITDGGVTGLGDPAVAPAALPLAPRGEIEALVASLSAAGVGAQLPWLLEGGTDPRAKAFWDAGNAAASIAGGAEDDEDDGGGDSDDDDDA